MRITIASGNPDKIKEINDIVKLSNIDLNLEFTSNCNLNIPEPHEPYATFMENAKAKAKYYADFTKNATLSEDAGLCIEGLDNFPGVKTKDFLLESGSLTQAFLNLEKLLQNKDNYKASFICAAALYFPEEDRFVTYEGKDQGTISFPARGDRGFGFDPIFIPDGYEHTMGELGHAVKNVIGHRAIAIRGILQNLKELNYAKQ